MLATIINWLALSGIVLGASDRFQTPNNGPNLGVWRITNDPTVRSWANYHNTQCWSPDGRYICFVRYGAKLERNRYREHNTVHLHDLAKGETRLVGEGDSPRWAHRRNWLFYVRANPADGPSYERGTEVRWLDADTGTQRRVCYGIEQLGETDFQDRWLYGAARYRGEQPEFRVHRIPVSQDAQPQLLSSVSGSQLLPSPGYTAFFTRQDHRLEPFNATRWWFDLEGENRRVFVPTIQQCHMSWLGSGEYLLLGNGLIRGRRWNEPFPSNLHVLAAVAVGDVSPCGRSGRYACGDSHVADLRSGDGWFFIDPLSIICFPKAIGDNSGVYDADPKGSPDGTKVCFVSNYDLQHDPLTHVRRSTPRKSNSLCVVSTAGFPESGAIVVEREVIGYQHKTAKSFEGLTRGLYETREASLGEGRAVTSFEARCLTDSQWTAMPGPSIIMRRSIPDANSPLLRQRQTDVYVVLIRKPDRPLLRAGGAEVELIPGEEHYEIRGYHLLRGDEQITTEPLGLGAVVVLRPGTYRAVAEEYSGVTSEPSAPLDVREETTLRVLTKPPPDFSWTRDRWLVEREETSVEVARRAPDAVREVLHAYDGVIHQEWYQQGVMTARHDLGLAGSAIRRQKYLDGRLLTREYFNRSGTCLSRELFDKDGFITEQIDYATSGPETDHWYFDQGTPVRQVRKGREFVKQGNRFGFQQNGLFIDAPRGAISQ